MSNPNNWKNSQNKIYGQNSVTANQYVNIMSGSNAIKSYYAPKNVGYLYYTSSEVDSNYKFSIDTTPSAELNGNDGSSDDSKGEYTKINNLCLIMITFIILFI